MVRCVKCGGLLLREHDRGVVCAPCREVAEFLARRRREEFRIVPREAPA